MSFLIDENLSRDLKRLLAPAFPECRHVADFGLLTADDAAIYARASAEGLALLSKDDDFRVLVERHGPPPQLVLVRIGNAPTAAIASALLRKRADVQAFLASPRSAVLEIDDI